MRETSKVSKKSNELFIWGIIKLERIPSFLIVVLLQSTHSISDDIEFMRIVLLYLYFSCYNSSDSNKNSCQCLKAFEIFWHNNIVQQQKGKQK